MTMPPGLHSSDGGEGGGGLLDDNAMTIGRECVCVLGGGGGGRINDNAMTTGRECVCVLGGGGGGGGQMTMPGQ